jgi:hypothetical protein
MYVFVRTDNPRPTFHLDMTPDERAVMGLHVSYWGEQARLGVAVVFGPVADPAGVYGIGVYRVQDEAHMQRLIDDDPAKGLLAYRVLVMPRAVVGDAPDDLEVSHGEALGDAS